MKRLTMLSLFSGIGGFEEGFKRVVDLNVKGISENDDYSGKIATKLYKFFHGDSKELGPVQNVLGSEFKDIDIITHGSPCQSFSIVNRVDEVKGGAKGSGTKSSLMWETVRIVRESKPKVVIWENVKSVLNRNNIKTFNEYLEELDRLGYNNYYEVLNATNFGIPQNRDRIFVISIRKDIDNGTFTITKVREESKPLTSILDKEILQSTIVPLEQYDTWINKKGDFGNRIKLTDPNKDYSNTLTTKPGIGAVTNDFIPIDTNKTPELIYKLKGKELMRFLKEKEIRIRFLSIPERFRLMGFEVKELKENEFMGISYSQLGKVTGNSIVTNIAESLMRDLVGSKIF